jgi:hypothetical protein
MFKAIQNQGSIPDTKGKHYASHIISKDHFNLPNKQSSIYNSSSYSATHPILHLQQTIGNHAVQRLVRSGIIQTKLKVSQPNDVYEEEANRIAEEVMRIVSNHSVTRMASIDNEEIGSKCSACETNKEEEEDEKLSISKKPPITWNLEATEEITNGIKGINNVRSSNGAPLDDATKEFMETRFNYDFNNVRIYTGKTAARSARSVNALAYTIGSDIVFNDTHYQPNTFEGRRLLAHELVHVVQNQFSPTPIGIQRYEGPEHQDLGDRYADDLFDFIGTDEGKKWAKQHNIDPVRLAQDMASDPFLHGKRIKVRNDLSLTPGQIISLMGDFYATWQDLKVASKSEIEQILGVMEKERIGTISNANSEYEKITKGRYTKLARNNISHFAPKNKDAWKDLHMQAIEKARRSRGKNIQDADDSYQDALLMDAAGGHFLTDAFASGHLMDSTKVQAEIQRYLLANPIPTDNPEMQNIVTGIQSVGLGVPLALKNIHDRMNVEGFEVKNAKGMLWRTYGDNRLKNAVETQHIAAYAIFVSRQQIIRARNGESSAPSRDQANEVLDLLPDVMSIERATQQAIAYIPYAVREISSLINRNVGMLDTVRLPLYGGGPVLPFVLKSMLGTISDPGRQKTLEDYERRKRDDPTTPYPTASVFRFDF